MSLNRRSGLSFLTLAAIILGGCFAAAPRNSASQTPRVTDSNQKLEQPINSSVSQFHYY